MRRGRRRSVRPPDDVLPEFAVELLGDYFPGLDLSRVRVREGVPWFVPMDVSAYTDRYVIYYKPNRYDPHSLSGLVHIAHELTHTEQYARHGAWMFRLMYIASWLFNLLKHFSFEGAYWHNRFEQEARRKAEAIHHDLRSHR